MSEAGYVYVAKHKTKPGHIKIGMTGSPDQRNQNLQGGSPGKPIEIVKSVFVDDMRAVEKAFHAMLKQSLIPDEREWFNIELDQVTPMLALIERWSPLKKEDNHPKAASGEGRSRKATPRSSFRQPILNVLKRLGGRGRARDVLNGVKEEMNLNQADLETYKSSNEMVWKKHAHFARLQLKKEGVLRRDSPHGWWELA